MAGEDLFQKVWEIQIEKEEIILIILGNEEAERLIKTEGRTIRIQKLKDSPVYLGLIKHLLSSYQKGIPFLYELYSSSFV